MEGLGLRLCDCPGGILFPVFIRNWKGRRLKTPNAVRWIPLSVFVPECFLGIVRSWLELQATEADRSDADARLFSRLGDDTVIPVVHQVLRAVTGDDTLHLHVLRHSFGTWTFLRLMLTELTTIPELLTHLPRTNQWLLESGSFRLRLYSNIEVTNDHAYALAELLGHGAPETSLENYVHCLDILLPHFLEQHPVLGTRRRCRVPYPDGRR